MKILVITLLLFSAIAAEVNSFFYQPLIKDSSFKSSDIDKNLKQLKKRGVQQVFIQWTNYDSYDFLENKHFNEFISLLYKNQIRVVFGLFFDEKYYKKIEKGNLAPYYKILRKRHFAQYETLIRRYDKSQLGFYLPEEIDDVHFNTPQNRKALKEHLTIVKDFFPDNEVYFSTFFTAKLPPKEYALFVKELQDSTGTKALIQDGVGTGRLNEYETRIYLDNIAENFDVKPTIILEVFKMDGKSIVSEKDEEKLDNNIEYLDDLGFENISYFSYRYLRL